MKIHLNKRLIFFPLLFLPVLFASYAFAQSADIEFPIADLGNCGSKEECKAYCGEEENFEACALFAAKNKLEAGGGADKFEVVKEDGGPGNCGKGARNPRAACEKFCNDSANMRECVFYAKKHNLMESHELEEAEKVMAALDRGVPLPSGCANKESCEKVCSEPKNTKTARECFDFAEAAGLLPPGVSREQAEKVFKAIEEGRAPFKSPKDFERCENPENEEIMEKCINFAIENGFLSEKEAEIVKKTGGKGPGGCRGKKECEEYCKDSREECIAFAEEHNLLSAEEKAQMEDGRKKFSGALEKAPLEVRSCLEAAIGAENLEKIQRGEKRQTKELGDKMRSCFDSQRRGEDPFPPEVKSCIKSKIGEDGFRELMENGPTPELDEKMRSCFEARGEAGEMQGERGERQGDTREMSPRPEEGEYRERYDEMRPEIFDRPREGDMPYRPEGGYPPPEYRDSPEGSFVPQPGAPSLASPETYLAPPSTDTAPAREPVPVPSSEGVPTSLLPKVKQENLLSNVALLLELLFR